MLTGRPARGGPPGRKVGRGTPGFGGDGAGEESRGPWPPRRPPSSSSRAVRVRRPPRWRGRAPGGARRTEQGRRRPRGEPKRGRAGEEGRWTVEGGRSGVGERERRGRERAPLPVRARRRQAEGGQGERGTGRGRRRGRELTVGPIFARAKKSFYVLRCVGDKNIESQCAMHKFEVWSVRGTKSTFDDVPQTNYPKVYEILYSHCHM